MNKSETIPHDTGGVKIETPPPQPGEAPTPSTHGLSLRSNFAWVLSGNVVFAACQWGMIVALAKLGSTLIVGQFSLGLAIATPVLMFTNLFLRTVQATDARQLYSFREYFRLRTLMTGFGLAVIAAVAYFGNYGRTTQLVILLVAAAKGIETLSDIHYGLFQLNDRLDQTGRSLMIRGVLSVLGITATLYFTRSIVWGCIALVLSWLSAFFLFDVRQGRRFATISLQRIGLRRQWRLARLALPLGVVTTIAAVNLNMPRYFIHAKLGDRQLGIYSAMAYATVAVTLVSDSLAHSAIPRLSRLYAMGRLGEFRSLLGRLLVVGVAIGITGLAAAHVAGRPLLEIFYSPEYAARSGVFVLLMTATAIHCVASVFTSGITSARRFRIQVPLYSAMVIGNAIACMIWVPTLGLAGGAMAMIVSALLQLILGGAILVFLVLTPTAANPATIASPIDRWEPGV